MSLSKMLIRAAAARTALDSAIDRLGVSSCRDIGDSTNAVGPAEAFDMLVYRDIQRAIHELNALEAPAPPPFVDGVAVDGGTARDKPT